MKNPVSVVIPVFNEEKTIGGVLDSLKTVLDKIGLTYEIIVVDDGSTDGTPDIIRSKKVRIFQHSFNRGYGAALKYGLRLSKFETVLMMDGDGTYHPEDIPSILKDAEGFDMVVGARERARIPFFRRPAKWVLNKVANYLSGTKIPDLNSGLRVVKKSTVNRFFNLLPNGFSFTSSLTLALVSNNYPVHFVPINYSARKGKSKIRPIRDTVGFFSLIIRTALYFNPYKIFLPISLVLFLGGIILALWQAIVHKNITTVSVIIILAGFQIMAIGLLADLINKRTPM